MVRYGNVEARAREWRRLREDTWVIPETVGPTKLGAVRILPVPACVALPGVWDGGVDELGQMCHRTCSPLACSESNGACGFAVQICE